MLRSIQYFVPIIRISFFVVEAVVDSDNANEKQHEDLTPTIDVPLVETPRTKSPVDASMELENVNEQQTTNRNPTKRSAAPMSIKEFRIPKKLRKTQDSSPTLQTLQKSFG